jgi:hypothetical protein
VRTGREVARRDDSLILMRKDGYHSSLAAAVPCLQKPGMQPDCAHNNPVDSNEHRAGQCSHLSSFATGSQAKQQSRRLLRPARSNTLRSQRLPAENQKRGEPPVRPRSRVRHLRDPLLPGLVGAETGFHASTRISATQPMHLACAVSRPPESRGITLAVPLTHSPSAMPDVGRRADQVLIQLARSSDCGLALHARPRRP